MNNEPKLSIIVAIYNGETYLHQCIDSILQQSLQEIEIILVDDGSTDRSPAICDEYAEKDNRVRVIHQANGGMGVANNHGIEIARGQYIGFVEADDWIEPNMYEELYAKAVEYDVDVVKSLYTEVSVDGTHRLINKFRKCKFLYRRVDNPLDVREFTYGHVSHWSGIYRKKFIKEKVTFPSIPGAAMQDTAFNWQVYVEMKSLYILPVSFYNYRIGLSTQSISQGFKTALKVLNILRWNREWDVQRGTDMAYREVRTKATFLSLLYNISARCKGLQKFGFLRDVSRLFRDCLSETKFIHFSKNDRRTFKFIAKHPFMSALKMMVYERKVTAPRQYIKFCGICLCDMKKSAEKKTMRLLGIPYYQKKQCADKTKYSFLGIPYRCTKRDGVKEKHYFLGFKYKSFSLRASDNQKANDVRLLQVMAHANAISETHRKTFSKYKNCNQGKDVVLIASGPTLNYFAPIKEAVYVGVNKVAGYKEIQYDYLFFQDFIHPQAHEILRQISAYPGAKKFYGISQEIIRKEWIVPESAAIRDNAERYYVISQWKFPPVHYPYDIANEPLGDCGSVSFAAMQFILWTNPRRIYLVGQDVTSSYWDRSASITGSSAINSMMQGWREMKRFINIWYPEVEIVSINPIGLRGMFKDMYTSSYLAEHSEIEANEGQIINIG